MNQDYYFLPVMPEYTIPVFLFKDRRDCLNEDFYATSSHTRSSEHGNILKCSDIVKGTNNRERLQSRFS